MRKTMNFNFQLEPGKDLHNPFINEKISALVSIITPYYNAGQYFQQTFNCVINQTFPWFEWIIIDDGSTDESSINLLKNIISQDSRIKYYRKENGGIASARNMGISKSSTDLIIPLDADDLISPNYIELNFWSLYFSPSAAWSYTDSVGFGTQTYLWEKSFSTKQLKKTNFLTCTAMIRKSALAKADFYSELGKNFNEDWHLWLKMLALQQYPIHIKGYCFWYRRTNNGVLSHIRSNAQEKRNSKRFIKEAAKNVSVNVQAIEYPRASCLNEFVAPKLSPFSLQKRKSAKPSILLLFPWFNMGGADAFNLSLVKHLTKYFDVGIITTVFSNNDWLQRFEEICDNIFCLPDFLEVNNYPEFISYYIKSRSVSLVFISNSYFGYYTIPWLRKHFPELILVDYVHMEEWYWRNGGYARLSGIFNQLLNKTFVCNHNTENILKETFHCKSNSVKTAHIGVDTDYYDPSKVKGGEIRRQYNLGSSKVILYPCRLDPQKRPMLMLSIISELIKTMPNVYVLVAGDGPMKAKIISEVQKRHLNDVVKIIGAQDDLRPFYNDSDVTLICSLREGLSLTAYESLAMGTPVISADVGGQKDLIDSEVGFLIPTLQNESQLDDTFYDQNEIDAYVQCLKKLLNDTALYNSLRSACRPKVIDRFSRNILVDKLALELRNMVEDNIIKSFNSEQNLNLNIYPTLPTDYLMLYEEIENYVNSYNYGVSMSQKQKLLRILNSRFGQYLFKIAVKFTNISF
jgi:glycosyltransferase, group 2 family